MDLEMLHGEGLYHSRHGEDDRTKKTAWPVYVKEEDHYCCTVAKNVRVGWQGGQKVCKNCRN